MEGRRPRAASGAAARAARAALPATVLALGLGLGLVGPGAAHGQSAEATRADGGDATPLDASAALPPDSPQAFAREFLRALAVAPTDAVLEFVAPTLIDEFLRANGTVVSAPNRRIVVRNVLAGARDLVAVQRYAVAPDLLAPGDDGAARVRVMVTSSMTITDADVARRKRAAADPDLRWALGPDTARRVADMPPASRDAYFDAQLGQTLDSNVPITIAVAGAGPDEYRVVDVVFGNGGVSLARLPDLVARARGSANADEAERKRSVTAARAALFAVGALVVMLSLRRYRKSRRRRPRGH